MFRDPFGRYGYRSVWREQDRLRRELDRLFAGFFEGPRIQAPASYPAMNVWTSNDGVVLTAELPGVEPDDIDISVVGDTVTVSGSRRAPELRENERYHRRERGFGRFTRTFQLPCQVDADKVEAVFSNGVLHISLPRAEDDKPKKISIKAA
ncbi:MAG: Hsp20/alpha crystallin family protein [Chloroflexota bacterium]